eukprot:4316562-Alexandrium_andersonii.AAC.1
MFVVWPPHSHVRPAPRRQSCCQKLLRSTSRLAECWASMAPKGCCECHRSAGEFGIFLRCPLGCWWQWAARGRQPSLSVPACWADSVCRRSCTRFSNCTGASGMHHNGAWATTTAAMMMLLQWQLAWMRQEA